MLRQSLNRPAVFCPRLDKQTPPSHLQTNSVRASQGWVVAQTWVCRCAEREKYRLSALTPDTLVVDLILCRQPPKQTAHKTFGCQGYRQCKTGSAYLELPHLFLARHARKHSESGDKLQPIDEVVLGLNAAVARRQTEIEMTGEASGDPILLVGNSWHEASSGCATTDVLALEGVLYSS